MAGKVRARSTEVLFPEEATQSELEFRHMQLKFLRQFIFFCLLGLYFYNYNARMSS